MEDFVEIEGLFYEYRGAYLYFSEEGQGILSIIQLFTIEMNYRQAQSHQ